MVPEGWSYRTISEILEKVSNPVDVDSSATYREIGIRSHGKGIFHKEPILGKILGNKRVFHIEPDCFVVNIVFAWEQAIAKTSEAEVEMIASHRFPMFRPKSGLCDIDFILYFFNTRKGKFLLELASPGGAGRNKTLGQSEFAKLGLLLPSAEEQKKIAQILSTWDKAITTTEQLLANSQQQKKALMQQLLTGKKRLLDKNGVRFGGEWQVLPLGQLTNIFDGTHSTPRYVEDGVQFYSVEHLTANDFSKTKFISEEVFDKESKRVKLERGDILMTRIGDIGTAKHLDWDVRASFYVSLALVKASESFDSEYMTQYINSNIFRSELWKRTIHVAFPKKINLGEISNCLVAIPSLEEQQKIAAVVSTADQEISAFQKKLEALKQEKKALMQQVLTGKRRVKIDDKEVA